MSSAIGTRSCHFTPLSLAYGAVSNCLLEGELLMPLVSFVPRLTFRNPPPPIPSLTMLAENDCQDVDLHSKAFSSHCNEQ